MKKLFIYSLMLFLMIGLAFATSNVDMGTSFDNAHLSGGNPTDESGNGYTLTSVNTPTTGSTGIMNQAFNFIRASSERVTSNYNVIGAAGSISAWVKPTTGSGDMVVTGLTTSGAADHLRIEVRNSGDLRCFVQNEQGSYAAGMSSSNWYHLVLTWNSSAGWACYFNGVNYINDSTASSPANSYNLPIAAGYSSLTGGIYFDHFNGLIDEFLVYDYELSLDEIQDLYNSGSGCDPFDTTCTGTPPSYNVTLTIKDFWNNSNAVNGVNATINGDLFQNSTGNVIYTNITVNASATNDITIQGSDYFERVFPSATMEDQTLTIYQTVITPQARSLVSNSSLTSVNYTIQSQQNTTFKLQAGEYVLLSEKTGYYDLNTAFNVSALDNRTQYAYMYDHVLTLAAINARTGGYLNGTKTGYYQNTANSFNESFNFSSDTTTINLENGLTYEFVLDPFGGYATSQGLRFNYTPTGSTGERNFSLYENNSIQFYFKNADTLAFITNAVNVTLSNANNTYNFNTSTGQYFLSGIASGTYTVDAQTSGFNAVEVFVTVLNNEYQELNVFFGGDVEPKIFTVIDNFGDPVEGVVITFTREVNATTVVYGQQTTDFSGGILIYLNEGDEYDISAVKSGYNTFTGSVTPFRDSYTINIQESGSQRYISTFDDIRYNANVSYTTNSTSMLAYFNIISAAGYLQYFGMSTTYNGTTYTQNTTGSPSGGSINFNISNISTATDNTLTVTYWFKSVNASLLEWEITYLIDQELQGNNLLDFDLSGADTGTKAAISLFVIVLSVGIGLVITRRMLAGVLFAAIATGFLMIIGVMNLLLGLLTIGVLGILLIADISTGANK